MLCLRGPICGKLEGDPRPSSLRVERRLAGRGEIKGHQALHPEDVVLGLWVWEGSHRRVEGMDYTFC